MRDHQCYDDLSVVSSLFDDPCGVGVRYCSYLVDLYIEPLALASVRDAPLRGLIVAAALPLHSPLLSISNPRRVPVSAA